MALLLVLEGSWWKSWCICWQVCVHRSKQAEWLLHFKEETISLCHPERSEGSRSGERSFAALRMTILKRLPLTRKTSSLQCIGQSGYRDARWFVISSFPVTRASGRSGIWLKRKNHCLRARSAFMDYSLYESKQMLLFSVNCSDSLAHIGRRVELLIGQLFQC